MKKNQRGNALLLELIIVIALFAFCAVVLSGMFATAFRINRRTDARDTALYEVQNIADRLATEEDREMVLLDCAFTDKGNGLWQKQGKEYTIEAQFRDESIGEGELRCVELAVKCGDETLFTLPATRYGEVQP